MKKLVIALLMFFCTCSETPMPKADSEVIWAMSYTLLERAKLDAQNKKTDTQYVPYPVPGPTTAACYKNLVQVDDINNPGFLFSGIQTPCANTSFSALVSSVNNTQAAQYSEIYTAAAGGVNLLSQYSTPQEAWLLSDQQTIVSSYTVKITYNCQAAVCTGNGVMTFYDNTLAVLSSLVFSDCSTGTINYTIPATTYQIGLSAGGFACSVKID